METTNIACDIVNYRFKFIGLKGLRNYSEIYCGVTIRGSVSDLNDDVLANDPL